MRFCRPGSWGLAGVVVLWNVLCVATHAANNLGLPWPHETGELRPDPTIVWGRLDNGFRFAFQPTQQAPKQVSLRLSVRVGSLNEASDERGFAHFVEHLAFAGTTHFPRGTLVSYLREHGLDFGSDANATTGFRETVYRLDLPSSDPKELEIALKIFRDFADGILFDKTAVEQERGVILAEERLRNDAGFRLEQERLHCVTGDGRLAEAMPIGLASLVQKAKAETLRKFYTTWYRPERMTLVLCGDFDLTRTQGLVAAQFATLAPAKDALTEATIEPPLTGPTWNYCSAVDAMGTGFGMKLGCIRPLRAGPHTQAELDDLVLQALGDVIFYRRCEHLTTDHSALLKWLVPSSGVVADTFDRDEILISPATSDLWDQALTLVYGELRQALERGFSEEEIKAHAQRVETMMRDEAARAGGRTPRTLADGLVARLLEGKPTLASGHEVELVQPILAQATPERVTQAWRKKWEGRRLVWIENSPGGIRPGTEAVAAILSSVEKAPLVETAHYSAHAFAYEDFGPPGEIASRRHEPSSDVELISFKNGARLLLKKTAHSPDTVRLSVQIGYGRFDEPDDLPGIGELALFWFMGGLGRQSMNEIGESMMQHPADIAAGYATEQFYLQFSTRTQHMENYLKLSTAYLADPAFAEQEFARARSQVYAVKNSEWDGMGGIDKEMIRARIAQGDSRYGFVSREKSNGYRADQFTSWFKPLVASSPASVVVVGDFDVEKTIELSRRTLGTLPTKGPRDRYSKRPYIWTEKPDRFTYNLISESPQSLVQFDWPVRRFVSEIEGVRFQLLSAIVQQRLFVRLRQELKESYAPNVGFGRLRMSEDQGLFTVRVDTSAPHVDRVEKAVRGLFETLQKQGITAEETRLAVGVARTALENDTHNDEYWLGLLNESVQHDDALQRNVVRAETLKTVTAAQLTTLMRANLSADRAFVSRVIAQKPTPPAK